MLYGVDTGPDGALDAFNTLGMGRCMLACFVGFLYAGPQFVFSELLGAGFDAGSEHAAGGHELDAVNAPLQVPASGFAHLVGAVGFKTERPAVPSGHGYDLARAQQARAGELAAGKRGPQSQLSELEAPEIPCGGDARPQNSLPPPGAVQHGRRRVA